MTATTKRGVKCGNCGSYHGSAAEVQACYRGELFAETVVQPETELAQPNPFPGEGTRHQMNAQINGRWDGSNTASSPLRHGKPQPVPATEPQINFITTLREERGFATVQDAAQACGVRLGDDGITKAQASDLIGKLKDTPKAQKAPEAAPAKVAKGEFVQGLQRGGIHYVDGTYYRVHVSQRTRRPYASVWDGHEFIYDTEAIKLVKPSNKATAEQAKAFGEMHKRCAYCLTPIDTPESTAVGYGPICASKFGLPWGQGS